MCLPRSRVLITFRPAEKMRVMSRGLSMPCFCQEIANYVRQKDSCRARDDINIYATQSEHKGVTRKGETYIFGKRIRRSGRADVNLNDKSFDETSKYSALVFSRIQYY